MEKNVKSEAFSSSRVMWGGVCVNYSVFVVVASERISFGVSGELLWRDRN